MNHHWYQEDTNPTDPHDALISWLAAPPSHNMGHTERVNLMEDITNAANEITRLRERVGRLEHLLNRWCDANDAEYRVLPDELSAAIERRIDLEYQLRKQVNR